MSRTQITIIADIIILAIFLWIVFESFYIPIVYIQENVQKLDQKINELYQKYANNTVCP